MPSYDQVVNRWIQNVMYGDTRPVLATERVFPRGDSIFSYGNHFEMARMIREKNGDRSYWLMNGNTFSVSTSRHQSLVRGAIGRTNVPVLTIPFAALDEAQVVRDSIKILEVTPDWFETTDHWHDTMPGGAHWDYEKRVLPGSGGYQHIDTGEWIPNGTERDKRVAEIVGRHDYKVETWNQWWDRKSAVHNKWRELPRVMKNTGRKTLCISSKSGLEWELVDVEGELAYHRTTQRHWLGESLIEAEVQYRIRDRKSGALVTRRRKAKFLSGFDRGETRPSYFFCELPPKATATTVEEALEELKPSAVKLAEQLGREVKRQGDIFGVPVQSLDKRTLTKQGARFEKLGQLISTNHIATEVAYLPDGRTMARGTLRHAPQWRQPDHKRVTLGKEWHLIVKNTVPIAA